MFVQSLRANGSWEVLWATLASAVIALMLLAVGVLQRFWGAAFAALTYGCLVLHVVQIHFSRAMTLLVRRRVIGAATYKRYVHYSKVADGTSSLLLVGSAGLLFLLVLKRLVFDVVFFDEQLALTAEHALGWPMLVWFALIFALPSNVHTHGLLIASVILVVAAILKLILCNLMGLVPHTLWSF